MYFLLFSEAWSFSLLLSIPAETDSVMISLDQDIGALLPNANSNQNISEGITNFSWTPIMYFYKSLILTVFPCI